MKLILCFLFMTCHLVSGTAAAQSDQKDQPHQMTSAPADSRYELIQSPLAARQTFRLDKYTGNVWQLVTFGEEGALAWESIPPPEKVSSPTQTNYQMFTSGLAVRHTYLLNVHSGRAWVLREETTEKYLFWAPVANPKAGGVP